MRQFPRRHLLAGSLAAIALPLASRVQAQDAYPSKPVRVVSPWAPGGSADVTTRLVADRLTSLLGQPFVVEARAGATGTIGFGHVARSPADGYTLLLGTNSTYGIAPHLLPPAPYTMADFVPVASVATNAQILCIHPSVPATDLPSFIAHVRANPGRLTYGSGGIGGTSHMSSALLVTTAGLDMLHVPYRGSGLSQQALLANEVQMVGLDIASARPFIEAGVVRALAVTSIRRTAAMPDVPTVAEMGYPDFDSASIFVMLAPARTPREIVATLNRAINDMLAQPETRARFVTLGLDGTGGSPEDLARHMIEESAKWRELIARAGIRME